MPAIFSRGNYSEIEIILSSDEPLGPIDSGYLEDYYGNDNQVTLYNMASGERLAVLMTADPSATPDVPSDVFGGFAPLALLPDGDYEIQGRVRDTADNYTIIGAVQAPMGGERVIALPFSIGAANNRLYVIQGTVSGSRGWQVGKTEGTFVHFTSGQVAPGSRQYTPGEVTVGSRLWVDAEVQPGGRHAVFIGNALASERGWNIGTPTQ